MIRNSKVLGVAVVALLAMAAVASSASAAPKFTSESTNTTLLATAEGNHVFDAAGNTITCSSANFDGTTTAKETTEITFAPVGNGYSGCEFFGISVSVDMHGCDYVFHANNTVDIDGSTCTGITFKADLGIFGSCDVVVGKQSGLKTATYTNIGSGTTREVTMTPNVTGIIYTQSGGLCGSHTEGRYTSGNTKVTGVVDGTSTHTGVSWDKE